MQWAYRPGLDDALLDELLLPETSRVVARDSPSLLPRSPMELPRKRGGRKSKVSDYPLNAPSTVVRQALFPSGPGSYPSQITPLHKPPEGRKPTRQQHGNWAFNLSNEHRWREMGWSTSYPAEYLQQANCKDYKQTLAYSEELRQRQEQQNPIDVSSGAGIGKSPLMKGNFPRSTNFSSTTTTATTRGVAEVGSAQTEEERTLLKNTMLREGLLSKLHDLIKAATPPQSLLQPHLPPKEPVFDVAKGTEVLHLLLQLRDVGVLVVESILRWHELRVRLAPMVPLAPFRFENHNYCVKMLSDLNFLSTIKSLGAVLGVDPSTMRQNPFMMPAPIQERGFRELSEQSWRSLRLFTSSEDPVKRVGDAEKYLVWCLFNLPDAAPSPTRSTFLLASQARATAEAELAKAGGEAAGAAVHAPRVAFWPDVCPGFVQDDEETRGAPFAASVSPKDAARTHGECAPQWRRGRRLRAWGQQSEQSPSSALEWRRVFSQRRGL